MRSAEVHMPVGSGAAHGVGRRSEGDPFVLPGREAVIGDREE
jgi:hypothetical protein